MTLHRAAAAVAIFVLAAGCSSSDDGTNPGTDAGVDSTVDSSPAETSTDTATEVSDSASEAALDSSDASEASEVSDAADASDAEEASDASEVSSDGSETDGDDDAACKPGSIESEPCGACGTSSRLCAEDGGGWLPWGDCAGETGECTPKDARTIPCGRCGTRDQSCDDTCTWVSGACTGEGVCDAGDTEIQYDVCTDPSQVKVRTCSASCTWSDWSDCEDHP